MKISHGDIIQNTLTKEIFYVGKEKVSSSLRLLSINTGIIKSIDTKNKYEIVGRFGDYECVDNDKQTNFYSVDKQGD